MSLHGLDQNAHWIIRRKAPQFSDILKPSGRTDDEVPITHLYFLYSSSVMNASANLSFLRIVRDNIEDDWVTIDPSDLICS